MRQHGQAHDVTDGENVRRVGAHLDVDVDRASVCDGHASPVGGDSLAVGGAAYGLQDGVVGLRCGPATRLAASPCSTDAEVT